MPTPADQYSLLYEGDRLMEQIRQYLLSVIGAAILCGIVNSLIGKKSAHAAIIKLISGLCMTFTVISPLLKVQMNDYSDYFNSFADDAEKVVASGEEIAAKELRAIIKGRTEAYILDKAASLGLDVEVEVTLSNDIPPLPCAVTISGSASPYSKNALAQYIANDLGIPKEDQIWM